MSIASNLSLGPFPKKFWAKNLISGLKIPFLMFLTEGGDEITHRVGNFVTLTKIKKMGLGDDIGQKKPCHHLGPFFIVFPTGKNFGLPKRIFEKKIEKCKKCDEITRFDGIHFLQLLGTDLENLPK